MKPSHPSSLATVLCLLAALAVNLRGEEIYPKQRRLTGHTGSVLAVRFRDEGRTLVSSSRDDTIRVWDVATGQLKRTVAGHKNDVYGLAFSHDGKLMATGSLDQTIIVWDAKTFEPIRTLTGHTAAIREVEFSADDKTLASVGEDSTFRLWDVATGQLRVTRSEHTARVKTVAYHPNGETIVTAAGDATVRLWDARTGALKQTLKGASAPLEFVEISPDGRQLFGGTGDVGQLIFWDATTGKVLRDLPTAHGNQHGKETDGGSYSPDGKWAVSGSKDRSVKFWDPRTYQLLYSISGLPGRVESMTFSADGKTLATGFGGVDFTISLWDLSGLR